MILADAQLRRRAVERVANDRMMQRGKVHADLMRAAGVELDFDERGGVDAGEDAPVGAGFAGVGEGGAAARGHADAALGVAADGEIDAAVVFFSRPWTSAM